MARPGILYYWSDYKSRIDPYKRRAQGTIYGLSLEESGMSFHWIMDKTSKKVSFSASKADSPDFFMIDDGCMAMIRNHVVEPVHLDEIKIAYRSFLA